MPVPTVRKLLFPAEGLRVFMVRALETVGARAEDAQIVADVLLSADMRGVSSHGMIRLFPYYVHRLQRGLVNAAPELRVVNETAATLALDGDNGLGHPSSYRAMSACIQKAKASGACVATVRNSNHFGIAGYYAMLALPQGMIGFSFTNASSQVAPTYGRTGVLGTNPIAVAAPSGKERPYVLDMATSIVPVGKITLYERTGLEIPYGWGIDSTGAVTTDPSRVFQGGAILPLGGTDEMRGYKGYGLALMVEILAGVLSGSGFGHTVDIDPRITTSDIGHCFAAVQVEVFRPLAEFKRDMDALIEQLKNSPKAVGHDRIYIHGEKEFECVEKSLERGVPILEEVVKALVEDGAALGVPFDLKPLQEIEEMEL